MRLVVGLAGAAMLVGAVAMVLTGSPGVAAQPAAGPYRGSEPPARYELPRFSLRNYDGRRVHSGDLRGRVWVATLHAGADLTPQSLAHDIRVALAAGRAEATR
jgi:cytochrome oxidase Cu insertion factor (SCO1/SenC/PrrC family)